MLNHSETALIADGRSQGMIRQGVTLVLKQSDTLQILATNRLDDPIDASPAIVGKQMFLRGEKYLYCIEERDTTNAGSSPSGN